MTVFEIVCHEGEKFICAKGEELERFVKNYRRLKGKWVEREFPDKQFLVDHVKVIEMDEIEYARSPASTESAAYFGALQGE